MEFGGVVKAKGEVERNTQKFINLIELKRDLSMTI